MRAHSLPAANPFQGDEDEDRALLAAVKDLERRLVWEVHVHDIIEKKWPGLPAPMILDETMNKLTELAQYLEDQLRPPRKGGQTPDSRRRVCAGVCADAWRRLHGGCSRLASGFGRLAKSTGRRVVIPKPAPAGRLKNWEPFLKWARDAADTSTAS